MEDNLGGGAWWKHSLALLVVNNGFTTYKTKTNQYAEWQALMKTIFFGFSNNMFFEFILFILNLEKKAVASRSIQDFKCVHNSCDMSYCCYNVISINLRSLVSIWIYTLNYCLQWLVSPRPWIFLPVLRLIFRMLRAFWLNSPLRRSSSTTTITYIIWMMDKTTG